MTSLWLTYETNCWHASDWKRMKISIKWYALLAFLANHILIILITFVENNVVCSDLSNVFMLCFGYDLDFAMHNIQELDTDTLCVNFWQCSDITWQWWHLKSQASIHHQIFIDSEWLSMRKEVWPIHKIVYLTDLSIIENKFCTVIRKL